MSSSSYNKILYVLIGVIISSVFFMIHKANKNDLAVSPSESNSSVKLADSGIGQYNERSNSALAQSALSPGITPMRGCDLKFSFIPNSKIITRGDEIVYSLVVSNDGAQTCKNASFSIYYSENESFVSSTPNSTAGEYYWFLGNIGSNKSIKLSLKTRTNSSSVYSDISNSACATADNSKDVCPENLIFVKGRAPIHEPAQDTPTSIPTPAPAPGKEYGIWIWESPIEMTPDYVDNLISSVKENKFNVIYVTIDSYLNIWSMPEGSRKNALKQSYMKALSSLINKANIVGIQVDVEGGSKDWALVDNRFKGYALIDFVKEYNSTHPNSQIRGFQYDVEPYLLPEYEDNKAEVLLSFVEFIDASIDRLKSTPTLFSVVIPHFYDSVQDWTPQITYNGKSDYAYNLLLNVMDKKPGSNLIIMAYRNYFSGSNGIESISRSELEEASKGKHSTKVIIAEETGDVQPAYVTFHNFLKSDFLTSLQTVSNNFGSYSNFGGIAVHYLEPFLKLK